MFGYIYLVRNKVNGKMYIGQKHSEVFDPDYYGSGVYLKRALNKYGKENFEHVKILEWCDTKESLDEAERKWIDQYHAVESSDFYNLAKGGVGTTAGSKRSDSFKKKIAISTGNRVWTEESRNKVRDKILGRVWINNGVSEKMINPEDLEDYLSKGYFKGRIPFTEEHIRKTSDSRRGHSYESKESLLRRSEMMTGKSNPFYGKTHSESQKEIWRSMRCEMVWVNKDGVNTTIHQKDLEEYLLNGWTRGMIRRSPVPNVGKVCINNGVSNKYVASEEVEKYLSLGWIKGSKPRKKK